MLTEGEHQVWIRTTTANGSIWGRSIRFTVDTSPINRATTPISPDTPGLATRPQFSWRPTSEALTYDVYLHNGISATLQTGISNITWTPPADLAEANWTWSVRPRTAAGIGSWSTPLSFNTTGQTQLSRPVDSTTESRPLLRWLPVTGATRYILQVDNLTTGDTQIIRENRLTETNFRPDFDLTSGLYRVWIRALNANESGLWSRQEDFQVVSLNRVQSTIDHNELGLSVDTLLAVLPLASQAGAQDVAPVIASQNAAVKVTLDHEVDSTDAAGPAEVTDSEAIRATDDLMSGFALLGSWLDA